MTLLIILCAIGLAMVVGTIQLFILLMAYNKAERKAMSDRILFEFDETENYF